MSNKVGESAFSRFEKAKINLDYLRSNSCTHTNPFSAIAELCDNAYDADAKNLYIDFARRDGIELLEFLDDGSGMNPEEAINIISFGHSNKNGNQIGRYGNGLKSGGFYLGRELLLLTKKNGIQTALFISHKFHEEKGLESAIFVPCPAFDLQMNPYYYGEDSQSRHDQEVEIISQYAPLGNETLKSLFATITGDSGTLILISGLKRSVIGALSINVTENDFQLDGDNLKPHQSSLRKYLEILYLNPKTRFHLRKHQVYPKRIAANWIAKRQCVLNNNTFRAAHNEDMQKIEFEISKLEEEKRHIESEVAAKNIQSLRVDKASKKIRLDGQKKLDSINDKLYVAYKKRRDREATRKLDENKINLFCGVEIKDRTNNGIHFYLNNRLIIWSHKENSMYFKKKDPKEHTIGISLFVNLNYDVFHPTHNKQGFSNTRDFNLLVKKCDEYLVKYSQYLEKNWIISHLKKDWRREIKSGENTWEILWNVYGYKNPFSLHCQQTPLHEDQKKIVDKECGVSRLCQKCRIWRCVKSRDELNGEEPELFQCQKIRNTKCNQRKPTIETGFVPFVENWTPISILSPSPVYCFDDLGRNIPSTSGTSTPVRLTSDRIRKWISARIGDEQLVPNPGSSSSSAGSRNDARNKNSLEYPSRIVGNVTKNAEQSDEESGNEEEEEVISFRRSQREVAKKPTVEVSRKRQLSDDEDDDEDNMEDEPVVKKKKMNSPPSKRFEEAYQQNSSKQTTADGANEWKKEKMMLLRTITRLEDKASATGHMINCVCDVLSEKYGVRVPSTGSPWDKLTAVYENIVPRSKRHAKK